MRFPNVATDKNRWFALVFLALGLAIVIIDNTVLNVAIPYILKDLNTSLDALQWVISGYALIIATLLITVGRIGDLFGRKKIFILGTIFFAVGSFIASLAPNALTLFFGEAFIEAIGAAMMLTSSLSLLASEFHGKERAIAFGIWGAVAGMSATIGPLLGGYFTTYYSWRWSLRINVIVALIAILGSVFIKEAKETAGKGFDWLGTVLSGVGLFSLIFACIEGQKYGWWTPNEAVTIGSWTSPSDGISIIPIFFVLAAFFLTIFVWYEMFSEEKGGTPLIRFSMFANRGFSMSLLTLAIVSMGQFGVFFILPIYLQNALGYDALKTGIVFLPTSLSVFTMGILSGLISSRIGPKWVVTIGMFMLALGIFILQQTISTDSTGWTLALPFIIFGIGIGMSSAQLTNTVLSSAPHELAGEASAINNTVRQVGTAVGIAIIGTVFATALTMHIKNGINADTSIPQLVKGRIVASVNTSSAQRQADNSQLQQFPAIATAVTDDIHQSMVDASKHALYYPFFFTLAGALVSFLIPSLKHAPARPEPTEPQTAPQPEEPKQVAEKGKKIIQEDFYTPAE